MSRNETAVEKISVWIGCLGCYNEGTLRGEWVTLSDAVDFDGEGNPFKPCDKPGHEECEVFDVDGPLGIIPDGAGPLELQKIYDLLEGFDGDLDALALYADHIGTGSLESLENAVENFDEAYLGQWESVEAYAQEFVDSLGELDSNSMLSRYFDYSAFAHDLELEGSAVALRVGGMGEPHLFNMNM